MLGLGSSGSGVFQRSALIGSDGLSVVGTAASEHAAMAMVTLQVIEGLERGRTYAALPTPVTLGREDDNTIRLNDERVSRFHAKIQEDAGRIILTDLDSTNGTRVNGHPVQMRVLQHGDQLSIGRCLLIYGSRQEIAAKLAALAQLRPPGPEPSNKTVQAFDSYSEIDEDLTGARDDGQRQTTPKSWAADLFPNGPPAPPSGLSMAHKAELSDVLAYVHEQVRTILQNSIEDLGTGAGEPTRTTKVSWPAWQRLLQLEMDVATWLRQIAEPDE